MALYRILILGRTPENAGKVDKALRGLQGLQSLHISDDGTSCYLVIEFAGDVTALIAMIVGALGNTNCSVQLMSSVHDLPSVHVLQPVQTHRFLVTHEVDESREFDVELEARLKEGFGHAFELTMPLAQVATDPMPGVMILDIQSVKSTEALLDQLEKVALHLGLHFEKTTDALAIPTFKPKGMKR